MTRNGTWLLFMFGAMLCGDFSIFLLALAYLGGEFFLQLGSVVLAAFSLLICVLQFRAAYRSIED